MNAFSAACDGRDASGGYNALAPDGVEDIDERDDRPICHPEMPAKRPSMQLLISCREIARVIRDSGALNVHEGRFQ
jgi:hypothetical protein